MTEYTQTLREADRRGRLLELATKVARNPGSILRAPEKVKDYLNWPKVYNLIDGYVESKVSPFNFIQIGANDGVSHDPLHERIVRDGWHGILVEPEPNQFAALKANYATSTHLTFVEAAITDKDGSVVLNRFSDVRGAESHAVSEEAYAKSAKLLGLRNGSGASDRIVVPSLRMETLIRQTGLTNIDLVAVDAEGCDGQIVKELISLDLSPAFILYEHLMMAPQERGSIANLLEEQGYKLINLKQDTFAYHLPLLA